MKTFNKDLISQEPLDYRELNKAADALDMVVLAQEQVQKTQLELDNLIKKGEASVLTPPELAEIEKSQKELASLIPRSIVDNFGRQKVVFLKATDEEVDAHKGHAKEAKTEKLKKYVAEGKDDQLKKIASDELKSRGEKDKSDKDATDKKGKEYDEDEKVTVKLTPTSSAHGTYDSPHEKDGFHYVKVGNQLHTVADKALTKKVVAKAIVELEDKLSKAMEAGGNPLVTQDLEGSDDEAKKKKDKDKKKKRKLDNEDDINEAVKSYINEEDPEKAKRWIRHRAKVLGLEKALPDSWSK